MKIAICQCPHRGFIDKQKIKTIAASALAAGLEVEIVNDLCKCAQEGALKQYSESVVIACYERAVRALFDYCSCSANDIKDIRNSSAEEILDSLGIKTTAHEYELPTPAIETEAWYPVIDRDRCTSCGKCHDFCLFGVYSLEDGKAKVTAPANCKNNCPACARICPVKAVIFPKYEKSPINGGLEDEEGAVAIDTSALYTNDLYKKLAARRTTSIPLFKDKKK